MSRSKTHTKMRIYHGTSVIFKPVSWQNCLYQFDKRPFILE